MRPLLISFVVVTSDPAKVEEATRWERLESSLETAAELTDRYSAKEIHYILNGEGKWQFNYLLTNDGKVIGTKQGFARRAHTIRLMRQYKETGILEYNTMLPSEDDVYSAEDELANIEFLMKNKQALSFGGTASGYETIPTTEQQQQNIIRHN